MFQKLVQPLMQQCLHGQIPRHDQNVGFKGQLGSQATWNFFDKPELTLISKQLQKPHQDTHT